jgi:hypothetical protein
MAVTIRFDPPTPPYPVDAVVGFEAVVVNETGVTEYRWYVDDEYVGSGQQGVWYRFLEPGEYEVRVGLRRGSNFDEVSETRMLVVDEPGVGVLGRYRNRFEAHGGAENLKIVSSYWMGGSNEWSKPLTFNGGSVGAVEHYILHTGAQADGYNSGFFAYVPRGRNDVRFRVVHFQWPENANAGNAPRGALHYSGSLPLHGKKVVPESLRFTRTAARMCDAEWRIEDGSVCRARINKFKDSNTIRYSGIDDLGCEAVGVSGRWSITQDNGYRGVLDLNQDPNGGLTGNASFNGGLSGSIRGTVSGSTVEFTIAFPSGVRGNYRGTLSNGGTTLTGGDTQSSTGESTGWQATRQ